MNWLKKLWAWLTGKAKKKVDDTIPVIVVPPAKPTICGCNLLRLLCDPDPAKYTPEYVSINCHYEECGSESQTGLMIRTMFWRAGAGEWWMLSSLGLGNFRRLGDKIKADCFIANGIQYHCRGFCLNEPRVSEKNPVLDWPGNEAPYDGRRLHILWECHEV